METSTLHEIIDRLEFVDSIPVVEKRVRALKKLQFEKLKMDSELEKKIFELSCEYEPKYASILSKRSEIINGKHEPNESECDFSLSSDKEPKKCKINLKNDLKSVDGIPGFWLRAMKNCGDISDWIEPYDEPVLLNLVDIGVTLSTDPYSFTLSFAFKPNEYFSNTELTKEYKIDFGPDPNFPWNMNDYFVVSRKGCAIEWKEGKDVTKRTRKIKTKKTKQTDERVETLSSFFDFFSPPAEPPRDDDEDDDLEEDWNLGKLLYSGFVRNAVLYFTGEIPDSEYSSDESDSVSHESSPSSKCLNASDREDEEQDGEEESDGEEEQ